MGARWLVNAVLLALPVGTTIGVLLGLDSHRQSTGQAPLFDGEDGRGNGAGGGSSSDNRVTNSQYCQKQVGISPASTGVQYICKHTRLDRRAGSRILPRCTLGWGMECALSDRWLTLHEVNPNQWGWTEGTPGAMCMNVSSRGLSRSLPEQDMADANNQVTTFHNGTYATQSSAPSFSVTWQYPPASEVQPVHAFPNIQLDGKALPMSLQNLQNINLELRWTYGVGNEPVATTDVAGLATNLANTNVAIDMFLDRDERKSKNSSAATFEVMVWFASFGTAAQPIGLESGVVSTHILNGTTFNLYIGQNNIGQNVLTWEAAVMTEDFVGDIAPLLTELASIPQANFSTQSLTLGHLGVGSEAFSASHNITFSMPVLSVDISA
ncbi:glycoside hydrolase family 12 protein [Diplocarpon rosae]|nr:glycoside hydrolase family 12 protein [Diplocarpon rosae]